MLVIVFAALTLKWTMTSRPFIWQRKRDTWKCSSSSCSKPEARFTFGPKTAWRPCTPPLRWAVLAVWNGWWVFGNRIVAVALAITMAYEVGVPKLNYFGAFPLPYIRWRLGGALLPEKIDWQIIKILFNAYFQQKKNIYINLNFFCTYRCKTVIREWCKTLVDLDLYKKL